MSPTELIAANGYESFVQASYHDFIGRLPVDEELSTYATALQAGTMSSQGYLTNLSVSDEWTRAIVTKMYRDTLQRDPDPVGLGGWSWWLRSGKFSVAQVASFFYASDEYFDDHAGASAATWVTQLYQKLLNRDPDPLGLAYWINQTNNPQYGRSWVAYNFYQSDESRMKRVDALYQTLLARGSDPMGLAFWKVQVLSTGDLALATQIAGSQEYWDKAHVRYPSVTPVAVIVTDSLPEATVGSTYSATLVGSGGIPPYTWADVGLTSPDLTVNPSTGVVSGTPTSDGTLQMQITLADTTGRWRVKTIPLPIVKALRIVTPSLPHAMAGDAYSATVFGEGGHPPYTWSATGLPAGLTMNASTGVISGLPTAAGSLSVTVSLKDAAASPRTATAMVGLVVDISAVAVKISAGSYHSCALTSVGGVKCWGLNTAGQLGNGTTTDRRTPVDVVGLTSGVTAVAASDTGACALTSGGGVKCWGYNGDGEVGDGSAATRLTPVDVAGLTSGVTAITFGYEHACALTSAGTVKCWGLNDSAQLGDGTKTNRSTPVDVVGLSGVTAIAAGIGHTCALASAVVKCWGMNSSGQLGDGTTTDRPAPVSVTGLSSGVTALSAGDSHTCVVTSGSGVQCWGDNSYGQLGDTTTANRLSPVNVAGLGSGVAAALSAGGTSTCVVTSGGGARCWGYNLYGSLGDGTTTDRANPVGVVGLSSGVTAISTGYEHSCAVLSGGRAACWGNNDWGELGDNTTISRATPADVYGIHGS